MRLTLLGTQGWIPTADRETTCITVDDGHVLFIFDAGTGLGRLVQQPATTILDDASHVHLFLTHYHLDHVCGLAYLPGLFADRTLTVHAPAAEVTGVDPEAAIAGLIRRPYNPRAWADIEGLAIRALPAGPSEIEGHTVTLRAQKHADTSVAYRLDDLLVLATDTSFDLHTADFAGGVEVLLHEAWIDGIEEDDPDKAGMVRDACKSHTSVRQAAYLADKAGVEELIPIHLNPFFDEGYYRQMEMSARDVFAPTAIYPDLYQRDLMG